MLANDAEAYIAARITRDPSPANEITTAVAKVYSNSGRIEKFSFRNTFARRPAVPIAAIQYDESKLRAVAAKIQMPANWRHWLWERSPKRPETQNAMSFLAHLYQPGENILAFDAMKAKSPRWNIRVEDPMNCRTPETMRNGGNGAGIWFLCNPTDGQWHLNPRQKNRPSCRSEESVTQFRYAVLESDVAPADLWLAFVSQIPARIAAIYSSGGRSIHTLIRIDADSKSAWDVQIAPLKRPLRVLGGDAGCLSAVRLSRLPGCARPDKNDFQKLLYLAPNPPLARLIDLPVIRRRAEMKLRWMELCPRWNPAQESYDN